MNTYRFTSVALLTSLTSITVASCRPDTTSDTTANPEPTGKAIEAQTISGIAQKGPFLNGAHLTLSEMNQSLTPTGRTFFTTIVDDSGAFSFKDVTLESSIAAVQVEGFFFNEITGDSSTSPLMLSSLTDLAEGTKTNINLVSHLERSRVEALIADGVPFLKAKGQALEEVFGIFGLEVANAKVSEELDITA